MDFHPNSQFYFKSGSMEDRLFIIPIKKEEELPQNDIDRIINSGLGSSVHCYGRIVGAFLSIFNVASKKNLGDKIYYVDNSSFEKYCNRRDKVQAFNTTTLEAVARMNELYLESKNLKPNNIIPIVASEKIRSLQMNDSSDMKPSVSPEIKDASDPTNQPVSSNKASIVSEVTLTRGMERLSDLVGGEEIFKSLPEFDFEAATKRDGFPACISYLEFNEVKGDLIRGINGDPNYEYLIVKYRDSQKRPGIYIICSHKENDELSWGCPAYDSQAFRLNEMILAFKSGTNDTLISEQEYKRIKYKELFTEGIITGFRSDLGGDIEVCLESKHK